MNNEIDLIERLKEYQEFVSRETRFDTAEEFLEFCKTHFVYYRPDFGAWIQTLIQTEEDFIQYIQRVCIDDWFEDSGGLMWFVNNQHEQEYVTFNQETALEEWELDGEPGYSPTEIVESYYAEYNPYFDKPFAVIKDPAGYEKKIFKSGDIKVRPEICAKMPFIARFVSHDSFDRMGSIKGNDLQIIPLNEIESGKIMFI